MESLTPIYFMDFLEYAETGDFKIVQLGTNSYIDGVPTDKGNPVYMVKTITEKGEFAGNCIFHVENNIAYITGFTPSYQLVPENVMVISTNYTDHAERIARLAGKDTYFPASAVRYVILDRVGEVFYINDGETEMLVVISAAGDIFYGDNGEVAFVDDRLRAKANERLDEHNERLAFIEEWEAANPGENFADQGFTGGGFGAPLFTVSSADINDIININEYLADNVSSGLPLITPVINENDESPHAINGNEIRMIVLGAILIAAAVAVIVICCKRKQSKPK
jgi:hypothetical protein